MSLLLPGPSFHKHSAGGGGSYLDGTLSSTEFELIAEDSASYDTGVDGQKWFNVITSPASGASQSDYDFYRGATSSATTDDPTFNGSVGTAGAYWTFDGGDFFKLVGANTTFAKGLHKSSTGTDDWWAAVAFYQTDATWPAGCVLSTADQNNTLFDGIAVRMHGNENMRLAQIGNSSSNVFTGTTANGASGENIAIVSHSTGSNNLRIWLNTTTKEDVSATYATETTDPSGTLTIGAYGAGGTALNSETRLYWVAMGNEYLDDTKAGNIISYVETLLGKDFTP